MTCIYQITYALKWDFAESGWIEEKEKVSGSEDAQVSVDKLRTRRLSEPYVSKETGKTYTPQGFRLRGVTLLAEAP